MIALIAFHLSILTLLDRCCRMEWFIAHNLAGIDSKDLVGYGSSRHLLKVDFRIRNFLTLLVARLDVEAAFLTALVDFGNLAEAGSIALGVATGKGRMSFHAGVHAGDIEVIALVTFELLGSLEELAIKCGGGNGCQEREGGDEHGTHDGQEVTLSLCGSK